MEGTGGFMVPYLGYVEVNLWIPVSSMWRDDFDVGYLR